MALSGWIIAYVVLFALLHVVLYFVYSRHEMEEYTTGMSVDSRGMNNRLVPDGDGSGSDDSRPPRPERDGRLEGETVECPSCGALNRAESNYTYCWNCISRVHQ